MPTLRNTPLPFHSIFILSSSSLPTRNLQALQPLITPYPAYPRLLPPYGARTRCGTLHPAYPRLLPPYGARTRCGTLPAALGKIDLRIFFYLNLPLCLIHICPCGSGKNRYTNIFYLNLSLCLIHVASLLF